MEPPKTATRFDGLAAGYAAYRPTYPPAVVSFCESQLGLVPQSQAVGSQIVDVGSGTGISAELFLRAGYAVTCIEPGADMSAKARVQLAEYPRARVLQSRAEATGLPDASADIVLAGHSFHWFDVAASRREFARILRPSGWVVLLWNSRDDNDAFTREYYERIEPFASDHPHLDQASNQTRAQEFFGAGHRTHRIPNPAVWDLQQLLGFVFSASYLPQRETAAGRRLASEVEQLFQRHAIAGKITLAFVADIYYGHPPLSK